jgi:hypothetical protein
MSNLYSFSDNWQLMFLPVFIMVFWLLFVLKNLSSFRKEFQNMDRKERSSALGQLQINDLKKKYVLRSLLGLIICIVLYTGIYFFI